MLVFRCKGGDNVIHVLIQVGVIRLPDLLQFLGDEIVFERGKYLLE